MSVPSQVQQPENELTEAEDQQASTNRNEKKFTAEDLKKAFYASDRSSLSEPVKEAADLLDQYTRCIRDKKISEAKAITKKLSLNMKSNFATTGWKLRNFADELRVAKRYLESIPMFVASASLFSMHGGEESLDGMGGCVYRLMLVTRGLVGDDVRMKPEVKDHVIPLMCDIRDDMEKLTSVDEERKLEQVNWLFDHIGSSKALIDEHETARESPGKKRLRLEE